MASRVEITKKTSGRLTPFAVTFTAASVNNHFFDNRGDVLLLVKNGGGAPINATIQTSKTIDALALADLVVAVAAGATAVIGPFPSATYEQSYTDEEVAPTTYLRSVLVDLSATTSVELAAIRVGD